MFERKLKFSTNNNITKVSTGYDFSKYRNFNIYKKKFKTLDKKKLSNLKLQFDNTFQDVNEMLYHVTVLYNNTKELVKNSCDHEFDEIQLSLKKIVYCKKCEKKIMRDFYEDKKMDEQYQISKFLELENSCNLLQNMCESLKHKFKHHKNSFLNGAQEVCDHEWGEIERAFEPCGPTQRWVTCKICRKVNNM